MFSPTEKVRIFDSLHSCVFPPFLAFQTQFYKCVFSSELSREGVKFTGRCWFLPLTAPWNRVDLACSACLPHFSAIQVRAGNAFNECGLVRRSYVQEFMFGMNRKVLLALNFSFMWPKSIHSYCTECMSLRRKVSYHCLIRFYSKKGTIDARLVRKK